MTDLCIAEKKRDGSKEKMETKKSITWLKIVTARIVVIYLYKDSRMNISYI